MATHQTPQDLLRTTLAAVAPGTALRDGLERILRGRTGALIVLGHDKTVEAISSGGFPLDVEFSATRLRELAKMDGAVVVDAQTNRIVRAAVQLLPDAAIETSESGTRHRTAERVAKQTGFPVISVSQSMRIVALYVGGLRYPGMLSFAAQGARRRAQVPRPVSAGRRRGPRASAPRASRTRAQGASRSCAPRGSAAARSPGSSCHLRRAAQSPARAP